MHSVCNFGCYFDGFSVTATQINKFQLWRSGAFWVSYSRWDISNFFVFTLAFSISFLNQFVIGTILITSLQLLVVNTFCFGMSLSLVWVSCLNQLFTSSGITGISHLYARTLCEFTLQSLMNSVRESYLKSLSTSFHSLFEYLSTL